MRKLPIGVQSFSNLRENNFLYIDKSEYIWKLINEGKVYFLSRPRRFGKSLFLSTLKSYFKGKKELFHGLKIESLEEKNENPWENSPVIYLSFAAGDYQEPDALINKLDSLLSNYEKEYGITDIKKEFGDRFLDLINNAKDKTGKDVVVLVDEYDKPILDNLSVNNEQEKKNRYKLKGFYGALKDADESIKFVFITGVTKFRKVSIFSDLNQLNDISLDTKYSGICGITEYELLENFSPEIDELVKFNDYSREECIAKLKENYDGYHFSFPGESVYNPFSLLNCFSKNNFGRYWFATGTPTFLIQSMRNEDYTLQDLTEGVEQDADIMSNKLFDEIDLVQLLYQSGYLTIKGYDNDGEIYHLGFPNKEVEYGFEKALIANVLSGNPSRRLSLIDKMVHELRKGEYTSFMDEITSLFASIPYPEGQEPYLEREWRNQLYLILKLLGQRVSAEVHSSKGRCDAVLETEKYIYIFEFKPDKTADEALSQINEMKYAEQYISSGKEIIKIGADFSTKDRTIDEWKMEGQT